MWYRSRGQVTGGSTTLDGHTDRPMAILREVPTEALAQPGCGRRAVAGAGAHGVDEPWDSGGRCMEAIGG